MSEGLDFGSWLRHQRSRHDLTQAELAALIGCSAIMVRCLENRTRRPSKAMVMRLLRVLDISPEEWSAIAALARLDSHQAADPPAAPAARRSAATRSGAVPAPLTQLIGREQAVADVSALLRRPEVRLVSLIGTAGVGKTRLAQAVALGVDDVFPGGVYWIPLDDISDPELLPARLRSIVAPTATDSAADEDMLISALAERLVLLVVDNCEHLLSGMPLLARLLASVPTVKVLTTSRERVRLYGETVYAVPPLALPPLYERSDWSAVRASAAAQLLIARIEAVDATRPVSASDARSIMDLCHVLEGNPLALEMVAAQTRWLSLPGIQQQLSHLLPALGDQLLDRAARQTSLWETIGWSYSLLTADLRRFYARCSLFRSAWTIPAALAICAEAETDERSVLLACRALAEKHLVKPARHPDGEHCFQMTFVMREFAQVQLRHELEYPTIRERFIGYYCAAAEAARALWEGERRLTAVQWFEQEYPNLQAALGWSATADRASAVRLCHALGLFWCDHGYRQEGLGWLQTMLAERASLSQLEQAHLLLWQGILSPPAEQIAVLADSLALYQSAGDAEGGAQVLTALGGRAYNQGRYGEAQQYWLVALDFWKVSGLIHRIVFALNNLGAAASSQGDWATAERYLQQACHYQAQVAPENMSFLLGNLAAIAYYRGDPNAAALLQEALVTAQREKRTLFAARCLYYLARIARDHHDLARAWELLRASVTLHRSLEMDSDWGLVCELAAALFCDGGDVIHAALLIGAAEALRSRAQTPRLALDQPFYDSLIGTIRQHVDPAQLATLWRTGAVVPLEEVLALLLDRSTSLPDHAAAPIQYLVDQHQAIFEQG